MHQLQMTQRHQTRLSGLSGADEVGGVSGQRRVTLKPLVLLMGLVASAALGLQAAQAEEVADARAGAGVFGSASEPSMLSLEDSDLEAIRGRYISASDLKDHGGDFVILWDETPAGGSGSGNKGTGQSISSGFGNQQSTSVTTRRGQ